MEFFQELDKVVDEYGGKINKVHNHKTSFKKAMDQVLSLSFRDRSWPEVFNGRMLSCQNVLSQDKVESYLRLLKLYVDILIPSDGKRVKKKDENNLTACKDLLKYLKHHRLDPDNSIIGLTPTRSILAKHVGRREKALRNVGTDAKPLSTADLKAESIILRIMMWSELDSNDEIAANCRQFAYQLLSNISINQGDVVMCRIRNKKLAAAKAEAAAAKDGAMSKDAPGGGSSPALAAASASSAGAASSASSPSSLSLSSPLSMPVGADVELEGADVDDDIVAAVSSSAAAAADTDGDGSHGSGGGSGGDGDDGDAVQMTLEEQEQWEYCRVYRVLPKSVIVHNSPFESKTLAVPLEDVIPFDAEMRSLLGYVRSMQTLVWDPVDVLYLQIQNRIKHQLAGFLADAGINYKILRLSFDNKVRMQERSELEAALAHLEELVDNDSKEFYDRMEESVSADIQTFTANLDPIRLFSPTREASFRQLRDVPVTALARNRLKYVIHTAQTNLEVLNLERHRLLKGDEKRELSEWYLSHIEDSVDGVLEGLGYDWEVVPRDYLEKPPRGGHLHGVRDNLKLIEECMNPENDVHGITKFMLALRAEVYVRLDSYVERVLFVVSETLGVQVELDQIADFRQLVQEGAIDMPDDETTATWIDDCFKDLDYIREMKELEEVTFERQRVALSKVVPITGLIFSRFHRVENELRTVLELWSHLENKPATSAEDDDASSSGFGSAHSSQLAQLNRRFHASVENVQAMNRAAVAAVSGGGADVAAPSPLGASAGQHSTSTTTVPIDIGQRTDSESASLSLSPSPSPNDLERVEAAVSAWTGGSDDVQQQQLDASKRAASTSRLKKGGFRLGKVVGSAIRSRGASTTDLLRGNKSPSPSSGAAASPPGMSARPPPPAVAPRLERAATTGGNIVRSPMNGGGVPPAVAARRPMPPGVGDRSATPPSLPSVGPPKAPPIGSSTQQFARPPPPRGRPRGAGAVDMQRGAGRGRGRGQGGSAPPPVPLMQGGGGGGSMPARPARSALADDYSRLNRPASGSAPPLPAAAPPAQPPLPSGRPRPRPPSLSQSLGLVVVDAAVIRSEGDDQQGAHVEDDREDAAADNGDEEEDAGFDEHEDFDDDEEETLVVGTRPGGAQPPAISPRTLPSTPTGANVPSRPPRIP
jgi:hypothetical protein